MAKYKVKHTNIMHNKTLYKEGSIIELTDEQAARLTDFVELVPETTVKTSTTQAKTAAKSTKNSSKTKTEVKTETSTTEGSADTSKNGGADNGK